MEKEMDNHAGFIVVSSPYIPGYRVDRVLGMTWGTVVRSRGIGYQITASIRSFGGGEIPEFTDMLNDSRRRALHRLVEHAQSLGANAVLSMAFDSSELGKNLSEVLAYGTAVEISPESENAAPVRLA